MLRYTHLLEVHTEFATLHLRGLMCAEDVDMVRAMCGRLPESVRVLRVDLSGIAQLDSGVRDEIVLLVKEWRGRRFGHVIITGSPAELESVATRRAEYPRDITPDHGNAALMASYL
jgi:ABC-type transporter Mla MlaB component